MESKNFYIVVVVEQNKNESIFSENDDVPYEPGFYAYTVKCDECSNLLSKLKVIGGLKSVNIMPTKKRANEVVDSLNESFKKNGTYLFE